MVISFISQEKWMEIYFVQIIESKFIYDDCLRELAVVKNY